MIEFEIEVKDRKIADSLVLSKKPEGVEVKIFVELRKALEIEDLILVVITAALSIPPIILAQWLYDKLIEKNCKSITIDYEEMEVTVENLREKIIKKHKKWKINKKS